MKSSLSGKAMILFLAVAAVTSAFAADGGKGNFQISAPVQVNGTTIPAGDYVAKWSGSGPTVQVNIVKNGKTLATVPAKLVQSEKKASDDSAEIQNGAAGKRELTALHFSGKKYSIELSGATEAMKSGDSVK